ncbi:MAG: Ig-like domain-containing protein [Methanobacteriaceae archaeon]|nr:Ig-like domain-containing protein [Methanobacteriaceae archaeon]
MITIIFTILLSGSVSAANYTVGPNSTHDYASINQAVSSSAAGDSITVYSNNNNPYIENVNIGKNLTIKANGTVTVQSINPGNVVFNINSGGSGTTIQGFTITGATTSIGIYLNEVNNCKILNNKIINCNNGISAYHSNNNQIIGNTITNTGTGYAYGIYIDGSSNKISGNKINLTGTGIGDTRGIHVWGNSHEISKNTVNISSSGTGGSYGIILNNDINSNPGHHHIISGNTISTTSSAGSNDAIDFSSAFSNNAYGNTVLSGSIKNTGDDNHLNFNRIIGSVTIINYIDEEFDSLYNWYGSNAGPGNIFHGNNISYNPWLVMNLISPSQMNTGSSIIIKADFTRDSNGGVHNPSLGHLQDGIKVLFTTKIGTITTHAYTVNGVAQATLKSGIIYGTNSISAELNNQKIQKSVKIIDKVRPKVTYTYPKNKATKVSRVKTIYLKFSEKIKASINWSKITVKNKYGKKIKIYKSINGNTLYIKTGKRIRYSYYTVYIPATAIKDYSGNSMIKAYTLRFKTGK